MGLTNVLQQRIDARRQGINAGRSELWAALFGILAADKADDADSAIELAGELQIPLSRLEQVVGTIDRWRTLTATAAELPAAQARRDVAKREAQRYRDLARNEIESIVLDQRSLIVDLGAGRVTRDEYNSRTAVLSDGKARLNAQIDEVDRRSAAVSLEVEPFHNAKAALDALERSSPWLLGGDPSWLDALASAPGEANAVPGPARKRFGSS